MYTKYTQKCIPHFDKLLYTFCKQNVYKICSKRWIHFVYINSDLQKLYIIKIMYTDCIQNSCRRFIQINVCKMEQIQILMRIWEEMPN